MKKIYLFSFLFLSIFSFGQNFGEFASGIRINNVIYNTSGVEPNKINSDLGALNFDGTSLGTFGQNSSCAKITAGEIKTFKNASANVCSASINWRVYPANTSPSGSFSTISLNTVTDCNTGTNVFNDGLGACASSDQKWKDYAINIDFVNSLVEGNYILEIYYSYTGSDISTATCETTKYISNSGLNYRASFTISNPIASPTVSSTSVCEGDTLNLIANPSGGIAPYTFSWTGPNGYTSTTENPTINNAALSNSGAYSVIATDACGVNSTIRSTAAVIVNAKITPEFDATLPAICKNGIAPLLSTTSTNEIKGSWTPSVVSNTATATYLFTPDPDQCSNPLLFTVFVVNNITPIFTLPTSICVGDTPPVLNNISNNGIVGTWFPKTVSNLSTDSYTFTPTQNIGQCALPKTVQIIVNPIIAVFSPPILPICAGAFLAPLPTTSSNGITGSWSPPLDNTNTTTYTFTPTAGQCVTATTEIIIIVNPNITPTFSFVTSICENETAPLLPTTSDNGITGTWNTPTVSNTATGTYIFTSNSGQCTNPTPSITVTVKPYITPTFSFVTSICENDTAPLMPTTSDNGITGTWNTPTVSNTATGTYTFTSNSGQCTNPAPHITVMVKPYITPTFSFVTSICENETAPLLPTTSDNGITGTWNVPTVSNTATGTYTFTSNSGQCTNPTPSITVTVKPYITPTFNPIPTICYDSASPSLPTVSTNGISGSWNPTTISATFSAVYTFTPTSGECVTTAKLNITVDTIIPVFNIVSSICLNAAAPILTTTSTNGITGVWNPETVSNTTSGNYTFTPEAGQCATTTILNITVNPILTPSFTAIGSICSGATSPILPLTSNNGITGSWNPAIVSNTASGDYSFTPNVGECAIATTLNVTVNPIVTPNFTAIAPICSGSTRPVLHTTSTNSVTGTWNPATVSNTATATYTFTPTAGQCALVTTISIVVNQSPTDIIFTTTDVVNDGPDGNIEITGVTSGAATFQYRINNGSFTSDTSYSGLLAGNYTITVRDSNGCEFNKVATINSLCIYPNAITPNNDDYNDTFNLKGCDVVKLELYNRYGVEVNSYNNYSDQWGGTNKKGNPLPDGTYFYVAEISDGTAKSGWVFVTR